MWGDMKPIRFILTLLAMFGAGVSSMSAAEPRVGASPVLDDRYPERRVVFPGDVIGFPDLTYSSLAGYRPLILDLYKPGSSRQPRPLVIYIHGGGWIGGHTRHSGAFEDWPGVLASLAARGYVVASVEYRLSSEAPFPAAVQDVKAAIRWLRAHANEFGIDKSRAVVWGGSAGGQLAGLVGASCGVAALEPPGAAANQRPEPGAAAAKPVADARTLESVESDCAQGVIAWYGVFDFSHILRDTEGQPRNPEYRYLGCAPGSCSAATVAMASAITHVDAKDPPVLMIHGVNDRTVPVEQSRSYLAALRSKGVKAELVEIPDVEHSFIGKYPAATREGSLRALTRSMEFIDATLSK
jgi:acetyl esterase/lipase